MEQSNHLVIGDQNKKSDIFDIDLKPLLEINTSVKDVSNSILRLEREIIPAIKELISVSIKKTIDDSEKGIETQLRRLNETVSNIDFKPNVQLEIDGDFFPPEVTVHCEHPVHIEAAPAQVKFEPMRDEALKNSLDKTSHAVSQLLWLFMVMAILQTISFLVLAINSLHP